MNAKNALRLTCYFIGLIAVSGLAANAETPSQIDLNDNYAQVMCSSATTDTFSELSQKANKYGLGITHALLSVPCRMRRNKDLDAGDEPLGSLIHKSINNGLHTHNVVRSFLVHLKGYEQQERQMIFQHVLAGLPANNSLLEEALISMKDKRDRAEEIAASSRMICRAIELFKFEEELGDYLLDPQTGCLNPLIGYSPRLRNP